MATRLSEDYSFISKSNNNSLDATFANFAIGSSLSHKGRLSKSSNHLVDNNSTITSTLPTIPSRVMAETLQQQGRLLLVALLENFCALYHKESSQNRRLFMLLCKRLCAMGVLEMVDFVDETVHVRSVYKRAFRALVIETMRAMNSSSSSNAGKQQLLQNVSVSEISSESTTSSSFEEFMGREVSRYAEDFDELAVLGRGGFGRVFKVQNRVDRRLYAIKKIDFASIYSSRFERIMREVRALANLEHSNIVRYHSAWIEEEGPLLLESDNNDDDNEISLSASSSSSSSAAVAGHHSLVMYIQMELCQYTLHDLISHRNALYHGEAGDPNWTGPSLIRRCGEIDYLATICLLRGIVKGLAHIHAQGLIHRDLKPQNIFFTDETSCPKIGDFGLVSESRNHHSETVLEASSPTATTKSMTGGLGTELYASPEQISGTLDYDCKADIYSLGIICFELIHPFGTQMERVRVLGDLRQHKRFPPDFILKHPKEVSNTFRSLLFPLDCLYLELSRSGSIKETDGRGNFESRHLYRRRY